MINDGRHYRIVITLISLLILSFIYQIFFFYERNIISGVEKYNKENGCSFYFIKYSEKKSLLKKKLRLENSVQASKNVFRVKIMTGKCLTNVNYFEETLVERTVFFCIISSVKF